MSIHIIKTQRKQRRKDAEGGFAVDKLYDGEAALCVFASLLPLRFNGNEERDSIL